MFKKIMALLLTLTSCVALLAGCGGNGNTNTGSDFNPDLENYVAPDLSGVSLSMYCVESSDYDAETTWLDEAVEKKLGVDLTYMELDSFTQQYTTMLAEGKVPDLTYCTHYNNSYVQYGEDGAYINIMNYLDLLPNIKAFIENPNNAVDVQRFTTADGAMYCLPQRSESVTDPWIFLYRQDIFEKHNLTWPTNQEEFVAVLRKLKELYPNSAPFVLRSMNGNMQQLLNFSHLWGASHVQQGHYNTVFSLDENGEYYLAQISEPYKEIAQFFNQLQKEGLMHASCATMDTPTWYESFASNTSFVTFDKTDRLPQMNRTGQSLNAEFKMVAGEPFNFGEHAKTTDEVTTYWADGYGTGTTYWYAIGNNENVEYSMAYLDWLYSEEGQIMTNWGVEGESYTVDENGNKAFIKSFLDEHGGLTNSGLSSLLMCGYRKTDAYRASLTESEAASLDLALGYRGKDTVQHTLTYNDDEQMIYDTYGVALFNYAQTQWSKFWLGQRDFAEWDQVLEEMKAKYHYDDLMEIHNSALERVLELYNNA